MDVAPSLPAVLRVVADHVSEGLSEGRHDGGEGSVGAVCDRLAARHHITKF